VASIGDTYTLSQSLVNQFLVGFHRSTSDQTYGNAFTFSSLGMNVPAQDDAYPNLWMISDGFQTGTTSALAFLQEEYEFTDTLSWVKGKHQFTFGGGFTSGRDNMDKFDFEAYVLYLSWADFLLGQGNLFGYSNVYESYEGIGNFKRDWRYKQADGFIQDDYVVAKHLTLNLGFRWERIGDLGSANGGGNVDSSQINPNPPAAGTFAGYVVNSNYKGPAIPTGVIQGKNTFGFNGDGQNTWNPRVGFAWSLPRADRFVLRGGIGIYHTTTEGQMNLLLAAEATQARVAARLTTASAIHFAGHAAQQDGATRLLLAPRDAAHAGTGSAGANPDRPQDHPYLDSDLLRKHPPRAARLAVFSACSTGRKEEGWNHGMGDIVDTLASLGVPDVVATRWQIDSASAVPMMDAFYGGLYKGLTVPQALTAARQSMANDPRYRHPYYWAAWYASGTGTSNLSSIFRTKNR